MHPGNQHLSENIIPTLTSKPYEPFTYQEAAQLQKRLNQGVGPEFVAQRAGPGGRKIPYIPGDKCINLANYVFGFNGWSSSIQSIKEDFMEEMSGGKVQVGMTAVIRVTLKDGTYHEDLGYGECKDSKGMAYHRAKKTATTDGIKRALRNFGHVFNCINDSDYLKNVMKVKSPRNEFDEENLFRHPDLIRKVRNIQPATTSEIAKIEKLIDANIVVQEVDDDEYGGDEFDELANYVEDGEFDSYVDEETILSIMPPPPLEQIDKAKQVQDVRTVPSGSRLIGQTIKTSLESQGAQTPSITNNGATKTETNNSNGPSRNRGQQAQSNGQAQARPGQLNSRHQPAHASHQSLRAPGAAVTHNVPAGAQAKNLPRQQINPSIGQVQTLQQSSNHMQPPQTPQPTVSVTSGGGFYSARAADVLQKDVKPSESLSFDPHRQSPSIKRSAGVNHSVSSPVTRDLVNTPNAMSGAAVSGPGSVVPSRPNFQQGISSRPPGQTSSMSTRSGGFKPLSISSSQTPGPQYPPLNNSNNNNHGQKRNSDGIPSNTVSNNAGRSALAEAPKAQMNAQAHQSYSGNMGAGLTLDISENASKRLRN